MCVPEEGDAFLGRSDRLISVTGGDDVLVFVDRRAVHTLDVIHFLRLDRANGKVLHPVEIGGRELLARPVGGQGGNGIEIVEIRESGTGLVMVPAHEQAAEGDALLYDLVRA